jgi:hypothetical protein
VHSFIRTIPSAQSRTKVSRVASCSFGTVFMGGEGYNIVVPGRTIGDTETTRDAAKKDATPFGPRPGSPHSKKLSPLTVALQHNSVLYRTLRNPIGPFREATPRFPTQRPHYPIPSRLGEPMS